MAKGWLACFAAGWVALAGAQDANFSTIAGAAVLCLDDVEPGFFYNYLSRSKVPYKRELGAYWFKVTEQLYGAPITEVFVSDGSGRAAFIGMISSLAPPQLVEAITAGSPAGVTFRKVNGADKFPTFVSSTGAEVVYQGKNGKIFCRRDRSRLRD